jgi:hypothetical protein
MAIDNQIKILKRRYMGLSLNFRSITTWQIIDIFELNGITIFLIEDVKYRKPKTDWRIIKRELHIYFNIVRVRVTYGFQLSRYERRKLYGEGS